MAELATTTRHETSGAESNGARTESNVPFLRGLAQLLGQFEAHALEAHRSGLLRLINDALADGRPDLLLDEDTPVVVIQRVAGRLASGGLSSKIDS